MSNFKTGDKVYYPKASNEILTIRERSHNKYPLFVELGYQIYSFTTDGKHMADDSNPSVFPATRGWYEKLVQIYPDLEPPLKQKEPREIIEAMLKAGYDGVPCKTEYTQYRFICTNVSDDQHFPFVYDDVNGEDNAFSSAIPYHCETGKVIIDYVDGKLVLED
ncbi:MAG: hypothetical protein Q4B81_04170 [Moraxella sp.]|nr:hypothetical protein [Moraxella sp.]